MNEKKCFHCIYFKPNIYFPYIGLCRVREEVESAEKLVEKCDKFRESSIHELREVLRRQGWLYCITCRETIVDESELEKHVKEHIVVEGVVIDEAVVEEAPSGD